ncbi:hypothetical protein V5O48_015318, partial [Marasmius crinis-equi]
TDYVKKALHLCLGRKMGDELERWASLVVAWLKLEVKQGFQKTAALIAVDRPEVISKWIEQARRPTYKPTPAIEVTDMWESFQDWWNTCVPEWQLGEKGELKRGQGDWEKLQLTGQNGIVSMVAALG